MSQVFTPSAPIDRLALFAGRLLQVQDVMSAVSQRGQHVALYGERGVGKTSLANVLAELFEGLDSQSYRSAIVNCTTNDSFASVWSGVFRELGLETHGSGPDDVRFALERLRVPALIVVDELDRLDDDEGLSLLADTVKTLSDHSVPSTLVLVGVAGSVEELVGEHESVERALVQVEMPRMSRNELREILTRGCEYAGLTVTPDAIDMITRLSAGLPHFTHLLGLHAAQRVVADDRTQIVMDDVRASIDRAVARHSIRSDYQTATRSPRSDNLFPHVLLACALAPKDELGFFTAGSIRDALEVVAGRRIEIPAFARHLAKFLEPERRSVLQRTGTERRYFYRFANPLLQPYVIMNALAQGLVSEDQLVRLGAISVTTATPDGAESPPAGEPPA